MAEILSEEFRNEYKERYENLHSLLQQAYMDRYFLEFLSEYLKEVNQANKSSRTSAYSFLGYLQILVLQDLCLILWKVYSDDKNKKANTIKGLNTFIYQSTKKRIKLKKLSQKLRSTENVVSSIRSQSLAHNDRNVADGYLLFADLYAVLDELREMLNQLCDPELHPKVGKLSDYTLGLLRTMARDSMQQMLYCGDHPIAIRKEEPLPVPEDNRTAAEIIRDAEKILSQFIKE